MIVIIVCVLLAAVFGNASASSQQTTRLFTFESEVHSDIFHGFDSSAASKVSVGVQGKFTISTIHQKDTESSCSWLLFQLTSVNFVPSSQADGINSGILNESIKNGPFLVHLCANRFKNIFLDLREDISIKNLKKAIAALFQYQTTESHHEEIDVCGSCQMTYRIINSSTILKLKEDCKFQPGAYATSQSEPVFATTKDFKRLVLYQVNENVPSHLARATAKDEIIIYSAVRKDLRISVISSLDINFMEFQSSPFSGLELKSIRSVEEALDYFTNELRINLELDALNLTMEYSNGKESSSNWKRQLEETIDVNRQFINESQLGTNRSVAAFIEILNVVQRAVQQDIVHILKDERNKPILNQLMDIFGCAQSVPIQEAILKTFDFKTMRNIDPIERYLWAISVNERPNIQFLRDFVELLNETPANEKLRETVLLTVAALAEKTTSEELKVEIFDTIANGIRTCPKNDEKCISSYLRALKNLKFIGAKSVLLNYALTGSRMVSANALKAVYSLPRRSWDNEILNAAEKIYYQKDRFYDSTARSVAIDILVDAGPNYESLSHLMRSLQSNTSHETRKYLLQRLQQAASTNDTLDQNLRHLMTQRNLFNYNFLSQKGLSNAIRLSIMQSENLNASIVTINEVSKNVLRRGHVGIILEQSGDTMEFITLDLFTSGLSSFLWSDDPDDDEEMDESEQLIAGVEIAVYGVQMRPFFFFHGHAELMGHIWAGTASERTPILQALRLLLQTNDLVPLSAGYIVRTNLMGAISFKLAGRITFSIWNKNAYSLGEASIAATITGSVYFTTFSVQNELSVVFAGESQIDMASNLDFYDEVLFCLQISQPQTAIEYEFEMRQTNLSNSHTARHRKKVHYEIPGNTIHLNKKNDEMCNLILQTHSKSR